MQPIRFILAFIAISVGVAGAQGSLGQQMLAAHNRYRAGVHVAPLAWSTELAAKAQRWAETLAEHGEFAHEHGDFGQNLFEISGARATPADVVKFWVSERANYDYQSNRCRGQCGHYTQVVWRDTKRVGCGVARAGRREVWVCDYAPPGNFVGERPY